MKEKPKSYLSGNSCFSFAGILLVLFILSSLAACKKNQIHTFVSGTVQDFHNGAVIAGARVYLAVKSVACSSCPALQVIDSAITDTKGYFGFDFIASEGSAYSVYGSAYKYYSNPASGGVSFPAGKISTILIQLKPFAYLRIHATNTNPFDWNDRIIINTILGGSVIFYGPDIDTSFTQQAYGAELNTFHYSVIKRNRTSSYSSQVYCTAFDTTGVQINY